MKLWRWAQGNVSDCDMKLIIGVQTFSFIYGLQLAIVVFSHSDNFSSNLQRAELCAVDALMSAKISVSTQSDKDASLCWTKVTQTAVEMELQAPSLSRCRKMPSRYFEGNAQPEPFQCRELLLPDLL